MGAKMDLTKQLTSGALALAFINPMWGTWFAMAMILSAGLARTQQQQ